MALLRTAVLVTIFSLAVSLSSASDAVAQNVNTQDVDRSVKPGDDFYRFANGGWLKAVAVPAGQRNFGTSAMLIEKTSERVRNLIREAAAAAGPKGSVTQEVGDYYAAFMDDEGIEGKGFPPLADDMAPISPTSAK